MKMTVLTAAILATCASISAADTSVSHAAGFETQLEFSSIGGLALAEGLNIFEIRDDYTDTRRVTETITGQASAPTLGIDEGMFSLTAAAEPDDVDIWAYDVTVFEEAMETLLFGRTGGIYAITHTNVLEGADDWSGQIGDSINAVGTTYNTLNGAVIAFNQGNLDWASVDAAATAVTNAIETVNPLITSYKNFLTALNGLLEAEGYNTLQ